MPTAVGIRSLFGFAEETVYGTAVTTTRWVEFLPGESLERRPNFRVSEGIGGGGARNARPGAKRVATTRDAGGTIGFEVAARGFGLLFKHLIGGTPVTTGAGPFTHTFPMGTVADRSLTMQKQMRDSAAVAIQTLTYSGAIITAGEFSIAQDGILQLSLDVDARDEVRTIAPAAASFTDSALFAFEGGALTVGGVSAGCVHSANVRIENPFRTDGFCLGTGGLKNRPADTDFPVITGSLNADLEDNVLYDRFRDNTAAQLVLSFVAGTSSLTITIPEIRFEGESGKVAGRDVIAPTYPFVGLTNAAGNPALSLAYVSLDAVP